ncbi:MAG: aminotransferase class V-fold PLP-dependent enzyme [Clostridium sp.]
MEQLETYGETEAYPFHMPGHKRQVELGITSFPNPFSVDITEINGFDNLHHPEGILKDAMEHAAAVYGSDQTYYLINGSTCGILSTLCGTVNMGRRIIMARNSHKAAYHAVTLNQLNPVYIYPERMKDYGIQGAISPRSVEMALKANKDAAAVYITSPTYEGIVSDVEHIAKIAHRYRIPLIVDEAHGAHFSFGCGKFPKSALECGADAVIQSLHKTLPSLTQTAVLHIKNQWIKSENIERYLQIFQTSSPSYVLLASIENCIRVMESQGADQLRTFGTYMTAWMKSCEKLQNLHLLSNEIIGTHDIKDRDVSKIVVFTKNTSITGIQLAEILRNRYHLESEMACHNYVLLMTSFMDTKEGLNRLRNALFEIDEEVKRDTASGDQGLEDEAAILTWLENPEMCMSIAKAGDEASEEIDLLYAVDHISSGFITVYPPGIPALVPGEKITAEAVKMLRAHAQMGMTVEGLSADGKIWVIKK